MKEKELIRLITAAQMYYEENMTQAEIAKSMGCLLYTSCSACWTGGFP